MRPAVFLDRDDTLIHARQLPPPPPPANPGDLVDPERVQLLPGAAHACHTLAHAGYTLVVVSNQGAVARGAISTRGVESIHDRLRQLLPPRIIHAFYYCPFHPHAPPGPYTREHPWRKPAGGMIRAALRELDLDPQRSWLVGDSPRDLHAAIDAGLLPHHCLQLGPDLPDLHAAAQLILQTTTPNP